MTYVDLPFAVSDALYDTEIECAAVVQGHESGVRYHAYY
jgi:hypothetical protein